MYTRVFNCLRTPIAFQLKGLRIYRNQTAATIQITPKNRKPRQPLIINFIVNFQLIIRIYQRSGYIRLTAQPFSMLCIETELHIQINQSF